VAHWWKSPHEHVLGGRDLHREVQGTWLGVTRDGRVAVLTNFRDDEHPPQGTRSRGAMVNAFLAEPPANALSTEDFVKKMITEDDVKGVGGFSLVCGRAGEPLAVVSNRTPTTECVPWIAGEPGQTAGLSNAAFGDRSWQKVLDGETLMNVAIAESVKEKLTEDHLIKKLLGVLSTDTLPRPEGNEKGEGLKTYLRHLRNSIFIPPIGGKITESGNADEIAAAAVKDQPVTVDDHMSGVYGTHTQTVFLVTHDGHCTFFERSLFQPKGSEDRTFHFTIRTAEL